MTVPKFIIFFKNYFLETRGGTSGPKGPKRGRGQRGDGVFSGVTVVARCLCVSLGVSSDSIFWTIGT